MSEFLVAAAFVVVPLFIIVPVVGKYVDMKLSAVQAARYSAWEYTVNYDSGLQTSSGFRETTQPVKSRVQVAREAERRFYSDTALPIDTVGDRSGYQTAGANPFWRYHNGLPMYRPDGNASASIQGALDTPDTTGVARSVMRVFGGFAEFLGGLLEAKFDAIDTRGKYTASVDLPVQPAPLHAGLSAADRRPLFGQALGLHMQARAGVLGQSWSAGAGGRIPPIAPAA